MKPEDIYPIKVSFTIPITSERAIERFVYAYLLDGARPCLIDTGVAGAENLISAAMEKLGKRLSDIGTIILTHSHPDHIGAAAAIRTQSGACVCAHGNEREWIEDTERQARERPVPGFGAFVSGPVAVDRELRDGDIVFLGENVSLRVLHTPGHSAGSISLLAEEDGILFCGDVVPQPGGMPVYEDVVALLGSLERLLRIPKLTALYSSWADPAHGGAAREALLDGIEHLKTVHAIVAQADADLGNLDPMELCRHCVAKLGLPSFAVNPLVARSFLAHRQAGRAFRS